MVALLGAAFSAVSYAVALSLKSEDALAPLLNGVAIPLLLLSGILLPMTLAPRWLRRCRTSTRSSTWWTGSARSSAATDVDHGDVGAGVTVALVAVGAWFGTRTFRRESA